MPDKGKGKLNPDLSEVKVPLNKECNNYEEHTEEKAHVLIKTTCEKEREVEIGGIEKGQSTFCIQKELEKVKIIVPLIELLKQPTYKAHVCHFMLPSTSVPTHECLNLQEEIPMVVFGPHVE